MAEIIRAKCGHPTVEFLYAPAKSAVYSYHGNRLIKNGKVLKDLPCTFCGEGTRGNLKLRTTRLLQRLLELHRDDVANERFEHSDTKVYQL